VGDGGLPTSLFHLPRKGKTGMNHVRRRLSYFSVIDSETGHPAHLVGDANVCLKCSSTLSGKFLIAFFSGERAYAEHGQLIRGLTATEECVT
jgi:hypothetical protein